MTIQGLRIGPPRRGPRRAAAHRAWSTSRAAAVLALVGVLAGCVGVPTSGPIGQGPVVDSGEATQFIRVIAAPPSTGAAPGEIVRGFLEANASLEQDHAIARRYLTPAASKGWDPAASTTVYDPESLVIVPRKDSVRVTFDVVGELQADGSLVPIDPPDRRSVPFAVGRVTEGESRAPQWRIADPPKGILISTTDLRRAYRLHEVYFAAQRSDVLVPDGRLLPVVGASLPTTLAEAVLAGPSEWLAPGVRALPSKAVSLAIGAVPVTDGVATVDLSGGAMSIDEQQRRDLAAQLTWTLTQLLDVVAVQLRVNGEPFDVPGAPTVMDRTSWPARAPDALTLGPSGQLRPAYYLLSGDDLVRVSDSGRTTVPVTADAPEALGGLAVSLNQDQAAAVEAGGRGVWLLPLDRDGATSRIAGRRISSVSFDVDASLWYAEHGAIRRLASPGGAAADVSVPDGLGPVAALRLARDATRVALVVDGTVQLGVIRERDGNQLDIATVERLSPAIDAVVDVAWRDAATLDVLGVQDDNGLQVLRVSVGSGQAVSLGAPAGLVDVAAAPGATTRVASDEQKIYGNVGLQWRQQDSGRSIAYPE